MPKIIPRFKSTITNIPVFQYGVSSNPKVMDGKPIPHIVVDDTGHKEVSDYILNHKHYEFGDVKTEWGRAINDSNIISLHITAINPASIEFSINFDARIFAQAIDHIAQTRALYLQTGTPAGGKYSILTSPALILEVPDTGFCTIWEKRYRRILEKKAIKNGASRKAAEGVATLAIQQTRSLWRK